jgi:hypothetical protein
VKGRRPPKGQYRQTRHEGVDRAVAACSVDRCIGPEPQLRQSHRGYSQTGRRDIEAFTEFGWPVPNDVDTDVRIQQVRGHQSGSHSSACDCSRRVM